MSEDHVGEAIWGDVHKQENGCWTFTGPCRVCNVMGVLAGLGGTVLATNRKMYRMPNCILGAQCVNPDHVGTSEEYIRRIHGRTPFDFSEDDVDFLRKMKISLDGWTPKRRAE